MSMLYANANPPLSSNGLIPYHGLGEDSNLLGNPYEPYRAASISPAFYPSSPEPTSQFTPTLPRRVSASASSLKPDTVSAHFLRSETRSSGLPTSPRRRRRYLIIGSAFPAAAAILELLMLVYFLDVFLTPPFPRISPVYSFWPFVACVGSTRETAFRLFSYFYAVFFIGTFIWDLWLNHDASRGYLLRCIRLGTSVVAGGLLVALVAASIHEASHSHLYLISVYQIFTFMVKSLTYIIDYLQRKQYPALRRDTNMRISKWWKYVVLVFTIPTAILATIGVYGCQNWSQNQIPGTTCYILIGISAISDWVYGFLIVAFDLCLAFDIYHSEYFAKVRSQPRLMGEMGRRGKERESDSEYLVVSRYPEMQV